MGRMGRTLAVSGSGATCLASVSSERVMVTWPASQGSCVAKHLLILCPHSFQTTSLHRLLGMWC